MYSIEMRRINGRKGAAKKNLKYQQEQQKRIKEADFDTLNSKEKRIRIVNEQQHCCNICGLNQWCNKSIPLELDHIDGDKNNNTRKNLRLICPNCHAQTPTYKIGNNKGRGKMVYTDHMVIDALKNNTSGYNAMKSLGMNPHGGNYVRVRKIIKHYKLALQYTV